MKRIHALGLTALTMLMLLPAAGEAGTARETLSPAWVSALFMYCFGPNKLFTGGCVAVPKDKMRFVMKHVQPNCLIVIDSLENLGGKL